MNVQMAVRDDTPQWHTVLDQKFKFFPIVVAYSQWKNKTTYHRQPGIEIHITCEGKGVLWVGEQIVPQSPRQVTVFRGSLPHQLLADASYQRSVIDIDYDPAIPDAPFTWPYASPIIDFSWIPLNGCRSITLDISHFQQLKRFCRDLHEEWTGQRAGWQAMMMSKALEAFVLLQRAADSADGRALPPHWPSRLNFDSTDHLVQSCSDYVCTHLGEDLTLKTVARQFAVSEDHLTRRFQKQLGISYYQFVLAQRVYEGKRLLRESPEATIAEIAYFLGFSSPPHFSRVFHQFTGETPTSYRDITRKGIRP